MRAEGAGKRREKRIDFQIDAPLLRNVSSTLSFFSLSLFFSLFPLRTAPSTCSFFSFPLFAFDATVLVRDGTKERRRRGHDDDSCCRFPTTRCTADDDKGGRDREAERRQGRRRPRQWQRRRDGDGDGCSCFRGRRRRGRRRLDEERYVHADLSVEGVCDDERRSRGED